ncbi:transcriptional regulator [Alicyclobacillus sacchari]|uniref:LacI family DNA-binding transcriptional regulator n=1 Tax=Alicyclobacillus sacchari TaxID=392010 RepID=UPI0023E9EBBF|nr:LacI family DNA-binding transcriptional regulator [Alicyclobacillus sacchari]GMA57591.1 transcriptional regulator [Alicyclobacillus sacchari]
MRDSRRRPTIADVAKAAGVSKTTVSRFLSHQTEYIAEETYRKIEQAIQGLHYEPSQMARGLKAKRSRLIGIIVADIANPFTTAILRGAEDVCHKHNYSLLVCNSDNDPAKEQNYIRTLRSHQIDGLIMHTTGYNQSMLLALQKEKTQVVLLDRDVSGMHVDLVGMDNTQATYDALNYLVRQGYRSIAYVTAPTADISTRIERVQAFRSFVAEHGIEEHSPVFQVEGDQSLIECMTAFMNKKPVMAKAVFTGNAVILLKAALVMQNLGYRIPYDVGFISFDDPDWADIVGITTVSQSAYEMGVKAADRLVARLGAIRVTRSGSMSQPC